MNKWLPIHRLLLALTLLFLIAQVLLWTMVFRPRRAQLEDHRREIESLQQRLARSSWPSQAERLEEFRQDVELRLGKTGSGGMLAKARLAQDKVNRTYAPYVQKNYETVGNLMRNVSLLDYQSEFNRINRELAANGVLLSPEILQLHEESSSPHVYQLLLHVWAVEKLAEQVLKSGMQFVVDRQVKVSVAQGGSLPASLLIAEPMFALTDPSSKRPYLLGFPVRAVLEGDLSQVLAFFASLDDGELFLPLYGFELTRLPPGNLRPDADGNLHNGSLRLEVECVACLVIDKLGE